MIAIRSCSSPLLVRGDSNAPYHFLLESNPRKLLWSVHLRLLDRHTQKRTCHLHVTSRSTGPTIFQQARRGTQNAIASNPNMFTICCTEGMMDHDRFIHWQHSTAHTHREVQTQAHKHTSIHAHKHTSIQGYKHTSKRSTRESTGKQQRGSFGLWPSPVAGVQSIPHPLSALSAQRAALLPQIRIHVPPCACSPPGKNIKHICPIVIDLFKHQLGEKKEKQTYSF